MSQTYVDDCYGSAHTATTDLQAFKDNFAALKSAFSGATEPANTVAGMWWFDTTANILKLRNIPINTSISKIVTSFLERISYRVIFGHVFGMVRVFHY